jgi:PAS domain S-box-containing protein
VTKKRKAKVEMAERIAGLEAELAAKARAATVQAALHRIAALAASATDMDGFYRGIHAILGELVYAENMYIALYDEERSLINWPYYVDTVDLEVPEPRAWEQVGEGTASGVTAYVLRTGRLQHLPAAAVAELVAAGEVESVGEDAVDWIGVPLVTEGRTVGVLTIQSYLEGVTYSEDDEQLMTFVAEHIAAALDRSRAAAELRQRNAELAIVNEVGQALAKQLDFDSILAAVGERAAQALSARGLSIAMRNPETGTFHFPFWIDDGKRNHELEGPMLDDPLTTQIVDTGRPLRISSAEEAEERFDIPFKISGTESYLGVPIPAGDRTIGVIAIGSRVPNAYSDDDERLLSTLATNMGVALDNARLFAELNAALEAQGEAEARYRRLVEELPLSLYIDRPDAAAQSIYVNPTIETMFGYPAERWFEEDFFESIIHPDDLERVLADHVGAFERGDERWSWDFRLIAADGRTVWVHDEAIVVKDEAGTPQYVQGFMMDVTDEREASAEVGRQKLYFEALVEASPVAIVVMDREELVTAWNPAAERLFGYPPEEAIGQHIDGLIFSEDRRDEGAITTRQAREKGRSQLIGQRMRKDGQTVDVEIVVVPLRLNGEHVGYHAIYHDISELQEARTAAETANQTKSAFLAAMSHEIRTPMNAIIGMSGLLADTQLNDEQRDYAETIRTSGDALLTIINDILDFSKIEAGKVELDEAPFSLPSVIEGALDVLAPAAAAKGIELAYAPPDEPAPALVGDAGRLRQILLNLLSNAVKFTESGEVVLTASGATLPDGRWEGAIQVRDTGIGIPPQALEHLFKSFSQVDASVSRRYGGTGLGLAISRRLSELMDGSLMATSSGVPGEGSTFRLRFRARPAPEGALAEPAPRAPGLLAGCRVLIVDDNETNRRILVAQTARWGMVPLAAASGKEALALADDAEPIDVALLDLNMPDLDGLELATRLRAAHPKPPIPVIILSSIGTHDLRGAPEAGTLTKPVKPSALHDALADVLGAAVATPGAPSARAATLAEGHPLRILLAEDNAVNRKLALKLLEQMGYAADVAANGVEAVEAVDGTPYDVVLMDVQMPELDGLEATRRIRAASLGHAQPRIVAMTANAMAGDREACLAAGMDDYLAKPIRPPELAAALSRVPVAPGG